MYQRLKNLINEYIEFDVIGVSGFQGWIKEVMKNLITITNDSNELLTIPLERIVAFRYTVPEWRFHVNGLEINLEENNASSCSEER